MRLTHLLTSLFLLSGCVDVETTFDLSDGSSVQTQMDLIISPEISAPVNDAKARELCNGAAMTRRADGVHCTFHQAADLVLAASQSQNGGDFHSEFPMVRIERLDETHARIAIDISEFARDVRANMKPGDLATFRGPNRKYFDGHAWVIKVKGTRILSSNGTVSLDGTTASRRGPVADLFDASVDFGPVFVTEMEIQDECQIYDCD